MTAVVGLLLAGCAGTTGQVPTAAPAPPTGASADEAQCNQRMVDEKVDLESVKGKMRRDNCLEAMKLKPQLARFSPEVAAITLAFAECKAEVRARGQPLAQTQDALFECATRHGGPTGRACLVEMVMGKVPVDALELNMGHCLQLKRGTGK